MKNSRVTIGIPAYNEEGNIKNLLESIFIQKEEGFTIDKVIVVCDGCTDNTGEIVKQLKEKFHSLSIINGKKQLGKKIRLQQIYKLNKSAIIITFDGDVVLKGQKVIKHIIDKFTTQRIGVVSCDNQPIKAENVINFIIISTINVWYEIRKGFRGGDNVYNSKGTGLALRRELSKKINFVLSILSDGQYIYFFAKKNGYTFRYATNAIVYYRAPTTLTDYYSQSRRTKPNSDIRHLATIFGNSVLKEFKIPRSHKAKVLITLFFRHPITISFSILFTVLLTLLPYNPNTTLDTNFWKPVRSTKKGIPI